MRPRGIEIAATTLLAVLILGGCATLPPVPADKNLLDTVLTPGVSREAVILKLGEPSASFEGGRILTYRVGQDGENGYFLMDRMVRWSNTKYSVVMVFDDKGNLAKHSLIQVR